MTAADIEHASPDVMVRIMAHLLADDLRAQLARDNAAFLIVTGGTTPAPVFALLRNEPLDWAKVTVTLSDERWVPIDHPDSNERMVRAELLQGPAAAAKFISLYRPVKSPSLAAAEVAAALPKSPGVAILGMGEDGHFASLFPGMAGLDDGLSLRNPLPCLAVEQPQKGWPRMSLTLGYLTQARMIYLVFSGAAKHALIENAARDHLPVAALLQQQRAPVQIHWTK